jgi:hypothetical protein
MHPQFKRDSRDIWSAMVVSLLLSYLISVIILLNSLHLEGWDAAGGLIVSVAFPIILGFGLYWLFQPAKDRGQ